MKPMRQHPLKSSFVLAIASQFGILAYFEKTFANPEGLERKLDSNFWDYPALSAAHFRAHYKSHQASVMWMAIIIGLYFPKRFGAVDLPLLIEKLQEHDLTKLNDSPELAFKLGIDTSKGSIFERFHRIHQIPPLLRTSNDKAALSALIREHTQAEERLSELFYTERNIDPRCPRAQLIEKMIQIADVTARTFDAAREFRHRSLKASQSTKYLTHEQDRKIAEFLEGIYPLIMIDLDLERFLEDSERPPKALNSKNLDVLIKAINLRTGRQGCEVLGRISA
jgi:hypothetical protein